MNGNNKRSTVGWAVGIALGMATSAAVVHGVTLQTFNSGETASAGAVNANFQALKDAIDGCTSDMVRVGSACVDANPATLWTAATDGSAVTAIPSGCNANGSGCTAIFAQSRSDAGGAIGTGAEVSWAQAATACANAGKRLASASEIVTGSNLGLITVTDGHFLWVDANTARPTGSVYGASHVHYSGGDFYLYGLNTAYTQTSPSFTTVTFRCAR